KFAAASQVPIPNPGCLPCSKCSAQFALFKERD
ncbi:hypothetical protein pipiens_005407, partial [Culex pipiens pipiens]